MPCGFKRWVGFLCVLGAAHAAQPDAARAQDARLDPVHRSVIQLPAHDGEVETRRITIGVDKSVLIETPYVLSDVLVSNPEVVDATVQSSQMIYLIAKDLGESNVIMIGQGDRKYILEVSVNRDLTGLRDMIARLIPGSDITAEMAGDNVVLSGRALTPIDANRAGDLAARFTKTKNQVINLIQTASKEQVNLRVKVAEMSRDAIKRLGVDLPGIALKAGEFTFQQVVRNSLPVTSPIVPEVGANPGGLPNVGAGVGKQFGWSNGKQSVSALVQMLERRGLIKTLAEPNLTAVSGETAKFLAGGEFPIPVAQGTNQIAVTFKQFGVSLEFQPVVMSAGNISLKVLAEVSELSADGAVEAGGFSLPGLKVRRAETTLELPSGGTLAMAGLLSESTRQSVEGVPGLKDVPTLGALFRSNDFRRNETELVILVTPYLATHAHETELALPSEGFVPESELKRVIFGRLNRIYGGDELGPGDHYRGDYGFIIDYPEIADAKG